jgi:nitroreductase
MHMVAAAMAAPDHEGLRPWKIILIEGPGRRQLSQAFLQIPKITNPRLSPQELARNWRKTMRAPTLIVLACHALGYGAMVLSGKRSRDPLVHSLLNLSADEEMIGFISMGTPAKVIHPKNRPMPSEHLRIWRGSDGPG